MLSADSTEQDAERLARFLFSPPERLEGLTEQDAVDFDTDPYAHIKQMLVEGLQSGRLAEAAKEVLTTGSAESPAVLERQASEATARAKALQLLVDCVENGKLEAAIASAAKNVSAAGA
eukprot:gnl/MRDRNA2_/MRDRNA2_29870_c0_seq1.p1 gnl/MRDRNA2_/MRDRNA2_29870_c0~~gnl/MRDRNA2_/MRDRNA2_29870_c0_seq1.p1  ORF type:complete len:119 (-),score=33.38 gnl/MRDRNA2_/MRDRNA2_29870_c0_seq1:205-561(-)